MKRHKLLERQIRKHLPEHLKNSAELNGFLEIVNEAYLSYDEAIAISNHASSISEKEYQQINNKLEQDAEEKVTLVQKLKETLSQIEMVHSRKKYGEDLAGIVDRVKELVSKRKKIERELLKNIKSINALIGSLHSGVLVENENRRIVFTNQTFCDMFGIPVKPELLIGTDCSQSAEQSKHLFEDPEKFIQEVDSLLRNKESATGDILRLADGRIFERDFIPIFIDNAYTGHFWNYTDITEKTRILESISECETRSRLIMNSALDAIIMIDREGKITFWNPQAEKIFGWKTEEVMDLTLTQTIMPPQHKQGHEQGINHFNKTGEGPILNKLLELTALHKNGDEFPVELSITPISLGEQRFFCAFIRDISDRKKNEKLLAGREEKYRNIIENMNLGLLEVDNDDIIQYANQSFSHMSGYLLEEIIGKKASTLLLKGENQHLAAQKTNLRKSGVADTYEIAVKDKRGDLKCWPTL